MRRRISHRVCFAAQTCPYFPSTTACTTLSIASVTRLLGRLKLFERMEKANCSPCFVVTYPERLFTPPSDPVFAYTSPCRSRLLKRSEREPSTPDTGKVSRKLAPQVCKAA